MSPEQSVGESTDARTDLYSLGIILYEMLAGTRPFTGKSLLVLMQQHLTMPPSPFSEQTPSVKVPKEVETLVQRLLVKNQDERISQSQEVLAELDRIIAVHHLAWPIGAASSSGISLLQDAGVGQHVSSISRAWTALRILSASRFVRSKLAAALQLTRRGPLQRVPVWALIGGMVLVVALPIGLLLRAFLEAEPAISASGSKRPALQRQKVEATLAPQNDLASAEAQGIDALEGLASRYRADPRIQRALLRSYTTQKRHVDAMRVVAKLATLDPSTSTDVEVIKSIVAAVQNDTESLEAAATLLEQDLGEPGVELLYDLTVKQTGARWKPRLNQSLTKPEVLAKASPAVRLALELRAAKRCDAKLALLPRAGKEGDRRALAQLKSLEQTSGCGFLDLRDCWPCLRKTSALRDAITALESRPDR